METSALIGAWHPVVEDLDRVTVQPNPPRIQWFVGSDTLWRLEKEREREHAVERIARVFENAISRRSFDTRELRDALGGPHAAAVARAADHHRPPANPA